MFSQDLFRYPFCFLTILFKQILNAQQAQQVQPSPILNSTGWMEVGEPLHISVTSAL